MTLKNFCEQYVRSFYKILQNAYLVENVHKIQSTYNKKEELLCESIDKNIPLMEPTFFKR